MSAPSEQPRRSTLPGGCGGGRREAAPGACLLHDTSAVVQALRADGALPHLREGAAAIAALLRRDDTWAANASTKARGESALAVWCASMWRALRRGQSIWLAPTAGYRNHSR